MDTTAAQRLTDYMAAKKISAREIEKALKTSYGYVSRIIKQDIDMSASMVWKICNAFDDLNPTWFVTGRGEMLLGAGDDLPKEAPVLAPYSQAGQQIVPLYSSLNNIAGLPTGQIDTTTQIGSLMVSNIRADCAIVVSGDSMKPRFLPGDYVLLRSAQLDFIEYGQPYVVELASGDVVLKLLKPNKDDNGMLLKSANDDYPEMPVKKQQIARLYRVVGLFRKEVIQ